MARAEPGSTAGARHPPDRRSGPRNLVFNVGQHTRKLSRHFGFFHDEVTAQVDNDRQRVDVYRAFLYAGVAGRTGPHFFLFDVIADQAFSIVVIFAVLAVIVAVFHQAVTRVHHDFAWRKQFPGLVGRTG